MNNDQKNFEERAMEIYCQLADIENLLNAMTFAARADEENIEGPMVISWIGLIAILKKEVTSVRDLAEGLEVRLRVEQINKSEVDSGHNPETNSGSHNEFIVPQKGVIKL